MPTLSPIGAELLPLHLNTFRAAHAVYMARA